MAGGDGRRAPTIFDAVLTPPAEAREEPVLAAVEERQPPPETTLDPPVDRPAPDHPIPDPPISDPPISGRPVPGRFLAGRAISALCLLAALVLVAAALLLGAQADEGNALVALVGDAARHLDLGVFDVDNGVVQFEGERADLKNALLNNALAALVWLGVAALVERLVTGPADPANETEDADDAAEETAAG